MDNKTPLQIAEQFYKFYHGNFNNKSQLQAVYRPYSSVTFEQNETQGFAQLNEIWTKIGSLFFNPISTLNAQPTPLQDGVFLMVTGTVMIGSDKEPPLCYAHAVQLVKDEQGAYCILNEVFRYITG